MTDEQTDLVTMIEDFLTSLEGTAVRDVRLQLKDPIYRDPSVAEVNAAKAKGWDLGALNDGQTLFFDKRSEAVSNEHILPFGVTATTWRGPWGDVPILVVELPEGQVVSMFPFGRDEFDEIRSTHDALDRLRKNRNATDYEIVTEAVRKMLNRTTNRSQKASDILAGTNS